MSHGIAIKFEPYHNTNNMIFCDMHTQGVASGMYHLAKEKIVHRDLGTTVVLNLIQSYHIVIV